MRAKASAYLASSALRIEAQSGRRRDVAISHLVGREVLFWEKGKGEGRVSGWLPVYCFFFVFWAGPHMHNKQ